MKKLLLMGLLGGLLMIGTNVSEAKCPCTSNNYVAPMTSCCPQKIVTNNCCPQKVVTNCCPQQVVVQPQLIQVRPIATITTGIPVYRNSCGCA